MRISAKYVKWGISLFRHDIILCYQEVLKLPTLIDFVRGGQPSTGAEHMSHLLMVSHLDFLFSSIGEHVNCLFSNSLLSFYYCQDCGKKESRWVQILNQRTQVGLLFGSMSSYSPKFAGIWCLCITMCIVQVWEYIHEKLIC